MRRDLFELLVCPACHGGLADEGRLRCEGCGETYEIRDGIPILLPPGIDTGHIHDEIDHDHGSKDRQRAYYDRAVAEEFEIARPNGMADAYRWLIEEKFARSVAQLPGLAGATVADACCGSGMDAEMLARRGARVVAIDISEGCVRRARSRARRYGLDYLAVVGDVERLPLRDGSVDIAYVHDGLHHLEDPARGLAELARVARRAVSINEPAAALFTSIAVRLGLALAREDAGNVVARLDPRDVARTLAARGFDVSADRYLMYYKHAPGRLMRAASHPLARPVYRGAVSAADAVLGRWGNKLQVTALRRAA